jgi:hypothetical protein
MPKQNLASLINEKKKSHLEFEIERDVREKQALLESKDKISKIEMVFPEILKITASIRSLMLTEKVLEEVFDMTIKKIEKGHVLPDCPINLDVLEYCHQSPSIKKEFDRMYDILDVENVKYYILDFWRNPLVTVGKDHYCTIDGSKDVNESNLQEFINSDPKKKISIFDRLHAITGKLTGLNENYLVSHCDQVSVSKKLFRNDDGDFRFKSSRVTRNSLDKDYNFELVYFASDYCLSEMTLLSVKVAEKLRENLDKQMFKIEFDDGKIKIIH